VERVNSWPFAKTLLDGGIDSLRNLVFAHLKAVPLFGRRKQPFIVGTIGSRDDYLMAFITQNGVVIRAGCYLGALEEFAAEVEKTYPAESLHGKQYRLAVQLVRNWAASLMPAEEDAVAY
jgi:hypothetical protein